VTAVQVPAELVGPLTALAYSVDQAGRYLRAGHSVYDVTAMLAEIVTELRALLPQPVATCPNCGHQDADHAGDGCAHGADRGQLDCDCPFSPPAVVAVRRLIAAERDSVLMGGVR
jgi:hypothetical protein